MKTVIVLAVGFVLGASYMNGNLDQLSQTVVGFVNSGATALAAATEPSTADLIEQKIQQTVDTVSQ